MTKQTQEGRAVAARLERILDDMSRAHDELLTISGEHRAALARADEEAIGSCRGRHEQTAARVRDLEQERAAAARMIGSRGQGCPTIGEVARALPAKEGERLNAAADRLRERVVRLRRENEVTRIATESLLRHVRGIVAQVSGRLDGSTYGPRPSGVEVRSPLRTIDTSM